MQLEDPNQDFGHDEETQGQACGILTDQLEHILIVDDDSTQTEVLSHLLSKQGYRVSVASSCSECLAKASVEFVDLILLDINMPDGDGLEVCSQVVDGSDTSDIPVIIVSGSEKPSIVRQARAAGCHYFLRKPYDPNALLLLVQNAIGESNQW